jgi:hypothetical protein
MAFAEDLLRQSYLLVDKEPKNPKQASLRRSVSTAYYSLFHLLIQDACANWSRKDTREHLARAFDHRTMKSASERAENQAYPRDADLTVVSRLRSVARTFTQLQQARHLADYSVALKWDRVKAMFHLENAKAAFADWKSIRHHYLAQRYLISLLSPYKEG